MRGACGPLASDLGNDGSDGITDAGAGILLGYWIELEARVKKASPRPLVKGARAGESDHFYDGLADVAAGQ